MCHLTHTRLPAILQKLHRNCRKSVSDHLLNSYRNQLNRQTREIKRNASLSKLDESNNSIKIQIDPYKNPYKQNSFGNSFSCKSRGESSSKINDRRLAEYKMQALIVDRRVKERNEAAKTIQRVFRSYVSRLNSKVKQYQAIGNCNSFIY